MVLLPVYWLCFAILGLECFDLQILLETYVIGLFMGFLLLLVFYVGLVVVCNCDLRFWFWFSGGLTCFWVGVGLVWVF